MIITVNLDFRRTQGMIWINSSRNWEVFGQQESF